MSDGPKLVIPMPGAAAYTSAEDAAALARIRQGYSNKAGVRASTAGGGTVEVFADVHRGRLTGTGYSNVSRSKGLAAGGELTFDLTPR